MIRVVEHDLRVYLGVAQLDGALIGELYVRLREFLRSEDPELRGIEAAEPGIVNGVAVTIYLVAATRQAGDESSPELLVSLQEALVAAFETWDGGIAGSANRKIPDGMKTEPIKRR